MKKIRLILLTLLTAAVAAASLSGCGKPAAPKTELAADDIRSVAVNGLGTVYILSDRGLQSYALAGDKKVEYVFDSEELAEAEFKWNDSGTRVVYSAFAPERIIANGETGLQFVGRYAANDAGRDSDMFVIQDIVDMNYTAAYFEEIGRDYSSGTPVINGLGVTKSGVYLKLNRPYVGRANYDGGVNFWYDGFTSAYDMPDGVIGAIGVGDELEEKVWFLTGDGDGYKVMDGEKTVLAEFSSAEAAGAFSDQESFYVVYKTGKVVRWTPEDGAKDFTELGVELDTVGDPFIWDGRIYWFDGEGLRTAG